MRRQYNDRGRDNGNYRDRGRERYRESPRNDYDGYDDGPYSRRGGARKRDSRGRFKAGYYDDYPYMSDGRRKIGFANEDDGRRGNYGYEEEDEGYFDEEALGYELEEIPEYIPEKDADEWVKSMTNADGTKGGHWNHEQTRKIYDEHKVKDKSGGEIDEEDFYVVMNMLYSDYCKALKENSGNSLQLYVALAIAFLMDDDAPENKLARYYYCIADG